MAVRGDGVYRCCFCGEAIHECAVFNAMIGVIGGFGAGVAYTFVRKLGKQGERGPVIVMCFSVFSCIVTVPFLFVGAKPMSAYQIVMLLLQELQLQADSFQSQRHTPRHLQRRYRCSTIRRLSLPPCWGLSFTADTGLSKCDRICYNNRQCNF